MRSLDLVIADTTASSGSARGALLLLPGGGQGAAEFLDHVDAIDPQGRWTVAAVQPWVESGLGPLWYDVQPTYDLGQLRTSVHAVAEAAGRLASHVGVEAGDVVVAGFSQGAVVATSLLLDPTVDFAPRGTAVLGGYLLPRGDLTDWTRASGRQVLCAHGRDDVSIFARRGWELMGSLQRAGASLRWRETDGRHRLAPHLVAELRDWLADLVRGVDPSDGDLGDVPPPVPTIELPDAPVLEARD
jgi:predicted esterase